MFLRQTLLFLVSCFVGSGLTFFVIVGFVLSLALQLRALELFFGQGALMVGKSLLYATTLVAAYFTFLCLVILYSSLFLLRVQQKTPVSPSFFSPASYIFSTAIAVFPYVLIIPPIFYGSDLRTWIDAVVPAAALSSLLSPVALILSQKVYFTLWKILGGKAAP